MTAIKIEESTVSKDNAKDDASEAKASTEADDSKATKETATETETTPTPIKTDASEATAEESAANESAANESTDEDIAADDTASKNELSDEDVAKEIGAAMVTLATTKDKASADTAQEDKASADTAQEDTEVNDVQMKIENESSDSETSSVEESKSKEKSNGSNWDNSYSNDLKKMYSDVDADTRAVAEEMIRAATAGKKTKPDDESKSASPTNESPPAIAPKPKTSKKDVKEDEPKRTIISKGMEPSALELALKQQGITHSDQLRSTQFPFRLHNMLDDAERSDHAHIVSWCPEGDSFKIHKPHKLISVLQKYFRQSKFKSFLRQLQGYNFKRITRGKDQGVVSHPLFLRGRRSVSTLMRRKRVGPKPEAVEAAERAQKLAAAVRKSVHGVGPIRGPNPNARILPQALQRSIGAPSAIYSAALKGFANKAALQPQPYGMTNPQPQDVLCVDYPNGNQVRHFQGNLKLASIVQKITGHYISANESVRTMIVNEISGRIKNSGSRFLKLSKDGLGWMECNREEMFRKVISCFEQEIVSKEKGQIDLTGEADSPVSGALAIEKTVGSMPSVGVGAATDPTKRILPRSVDVVLRGGPGSEREGNTYLKTMIQANVGQLLDSFEMKRIKCRAILERMKRRGSRFFLKLKDTDTDDEMYVLSDAEAQDVIYTAFCAEEKKVQSILADPPTSAASTMMRAKELAGMDTSRPGLAGIGAGAGLGAGPPPYAASMAALQQTDAVLLNQLKAKNEMSLLASHGSLKRPLPGHHGQLAAHESIIEKRIRAETDQQINLLIERERQRRNDPYAAAAGLAGGIPFGRNPILDSGMPLPAAAFGAGGAVSANMRIDQYIKERQADELLLKQAAAARAPYGGVPAHGALGADHPKSNNHFVEFLKKKYVKSAQERAW